MEKHPVYPEDPGYGDPAESESFRSRLRRILYDELIESRYYYVYITKFESRGPVVRSSWYLAQMEHVWPAISHLSEMDFVRFSTKRAFGSFPFGAIPRSETLNGTRSQINEAGITPFDFMTPGKPYADVQFRYHFYAPNTPAIDAAALREASARAVERAERAERAIAAAAAAAAAPAAAAAALGTTTEDGRRRSTRLKTGGRSRRRETKRRRTRRRI